MVIADNGKEFDNYLIRSTFIQLGVDFRPIAVRSPQSNGYIERQHKTINQALRAIETKPNWALRLPIIVATINNTSIEGSPYTPSQYALGMCVNLPGQIFINNREEMNTGYDPLDTRLFLNIMSTVCRKHRRYEEKNEYLEPGLLESKKVFIKRANKKKLDSIWHGPYKVLHASDHSMLIDKDGKIKKVSLRNVKKYFSREGSDSEDSEGREENRYDLRARKAIKYTEDSSDDEN